MNDLESAKLSPSFRLCAVAHETRAEATVMLLTQHKTHDVYTSTAYE